ncbi:MAG: ABC transporter permease [Candidatus Hodarchaeota archaeon]
MILANIVNASQDRYENDIYAMQNGGMIKFQYAGNDNDPVAGYLESKKNAGIVSNYDTIFIWVNRWQITGIGNLETYIKPVVVDFDHYFATIAGNQLSVSSDDEKIVDLSREHNDGIVIPESLANHLNYRIGDIINVKNGPFNASFQVIGIARFYPGIDFNLVTQYSDTLESLCLINHSFFTDYFTPSLGIYGMNKIALINYKDGSISGLNSQKQEIASNFPGITYSITTIFDENQGEISQTVISSLSKFLEVDAFIILIFCMSGVSILLYSSIYSERKKIHLLRLKGMKQGGLVRQYMTEGVIILVISLVFSLIGFPLGYLINNQLDKLSIEFIKFNRAYIVDTSNILIYLGAISFIFILVYYLSIRNLLKVVKNTETSRKIQ